MRNLLFLVLLFAMLAATAQDSTKWSLRRCVDYAVTHNISVKQADVQARITALQLHQSQMYQYPSAAFNTSVGPQFGRSINPTTNTYSNNELFGQSFGLQGNMQVFSFGKIKNNIAANQFNAKAALVDIEKAANDVSLNVATTYLQVLSAKEQIDVYAIQIEQTKTQLSITQKKVEAGALPELNLLELQAQLANDSSNLISTQATYDQNKLALKALLNVDAAAPFEIETPPVDKIPLLPITELQPEVVFQIAMQNQPAQKSNALKIKAAEKNVLVSKSSLYPSISGSYSLSSNYNNKAINPLTGKKVEYFEQVANQNFGQSLGFGLTVPIFNNGQNRINYENSKLNLQNSQLQQEQANQKLKQDVYTAYTNVTNALQKYQAGLRSIESAQKTYDFSLKRYEVGLLGTLDLITNQNNLSKAKVQALINRFEYVFRMKLMEFYKGQGLTL